MVKKFYAYIVVNSFLIWLENYKFDFIVLIDKLFAVNQLHTLARSLLNVRIHPEKGRN